MGLFSKKYVGIDVGASSVKVAEISVSGHRKKLENYAEFRLPPTADALRTFHGESFLLLSEEVSEILRAVLKKACIKNREATLAIPDFSTFFTTFDLPPMSEEEIPRAVEFKARHHVPLPLPEVNFDWQIIDKEETMSGVKMKVLLVAVPNTVLENYRRMANLAQLKLRGMEAEVFGLIRSTIPAGRLQHLPVCLIDIGWQSTAVSIVEEQKLRRGYSFDISGFGLAKDLSTGLQISIEEAEKLKNEFGLDPKRQDVSTALLPKIDALALEVEKVCDSFSQTENKKVDNVILAGGGASLFGLKEYLAARTKKQVQLADPFANIVSPLILQSRLKALGPAFAVVVGTAMMGTGD